MLALVVEGCANRAAFAAGVVAELDRLGVRPALAAGASSGSIVCAAWAAGQAAALPALWQAVAGGSIVRWRDARANRSPFAMSAIVGDALRAALGDGDLRAAPAEALCTVTRVRDRRALVLSSRERADFVHAVLGSCFVPILYGRPVRIDGALVLDGGARDNLPLAAAAARGATTILAVVPAADGTARPRVLGPRVRPADVAPPGVRVVTIHPPAPLAVQPWTLERAAMAQAIAAGRAAAQAALPALQGPSS